MTKNVHFTQCEIADVVGMSRNVISRLKSTSIVLMFELYIILMNPSWCRVYSFVISSLKKTNIFSSEWTEDEKSLVYNNVVVTIKDSRQLKKMLCILLCLLLIISFVNRRQIIFHHNNTKTDTSTTTMQVLTLRSDSSYKLDISPFDYTSI